MNIGVCGGTFDPFHRGHIEPVLAVRAAMRWDRVIYIPAAMQPFKPSGAGVSPFHRFAMAALATADLDGIVVSPRELERGGVSWTVDTLEELRHEWGDATIDWIIGDDNLASLGQWRSLGRILDLANFTVLTRESSERTLSGDLESRRCAPDDREASGSIVFARNEIVPVSSTEVRRRIEAGEPIAELVGLLVSRYIDHNALYRKGHS